MERKRISLFTKGKETQSLETTVLVVSFHLCVSNALSLIYPDTILPKRSRLSPPLPEI